MYLYIFFLQENQLQNTLSSMDEEAAAAADSESKLLGTDFMFIISFFCKCFHPNRMINRKRLTLCSQF